MIDDALVKARQTAAEILRQVLDNQISPSEARSSWPDYGGDASLDSAFHLLYHFEDDRNIRDKDPKYAEWQIGQMRKIIESFESGESLENDLVEWATPRELKSIDP